MGWRHVRRFLGFAAAAVLVAAPGVGVAAQQQGATITVPREVAVFPSLVFFNGKIYTMDDTSVSTNPGTIVSALAVREGRIMALGTDQQILRLAGPDTQKVDLKGRVLLPGIIDAHTHIHDAALTTWINQNPEEAR
jgi:imidazolonepropionase-like amidohydrolase